MACPTCSCVPGFKWAQNQMPGNQQITVAAIFWRTSALTSEFNPQII